MRKKIFITFFLVITLAILVPATRRVLFNHIFAQPLTKAVSTTVDANNGFPDWYQDDTGAKVVQCLNGADAKCALAAETGFNPANPTNFPDNFPTEFFWWSADALMDTPGGRARLILAAEGAFGNDAGEVAAGDQITFGRIRIRADGLTPNTDYVVTYPYGTVTLTTDNLGALKSSNDDIGCALPACDFTQALASSVFQSFLRWDTGAPAGYLGDGITPHTVTGSPTNNNLFRIEGPGLPGGKIETNLFTILGKLFVPPVTPPPGCENTAPDQPVLVSPANGATGINNNPVLNWNGVANFGTNCLGNNNQFEIFLDPGDIDPTTSWGVVDEFTVSKLILALASNSTYSWKVRANNGGLFTDSQVWTFTTTTQATARAASSDIDPNHNFATWYNDDNGIKIMPCLDGTDPRCVLPAAGEEPQWNPANPTDFPANFPSEFFYWIAESDFLATPGGGRTSVRMALEGAFANENPIPGDQMVFGRIRVTGTGLTPNSTYTVTHPYGVDTYQTDDLGTIRRNTATEDIGCVPTPGTPCDFSLALPSRVFGGFVRHTSAPDGYLGDAISLAPVIGSPVGQNFYKIEGPGLPASGLETNLFTVSGKIFVAAPPPPPDCENTAPDAPTLVAPANAAVDILTNPIVSWNSLANFGKNCAGNINRFKLFLDQGSVTPTTLKGTFLEAQTSQTILNLSPNTTYSWKIQATNGVLTADSEARTFTTAAASTAKAVSTTLGDHGYPDWYKDDLGVSVVPCLDGTDPICVLPAAGEEPNFDPSQPTVLPSNFPSEFFYWVADSESLTTPAGGKVSMRAAAEGAFLNDSVVVGDQMVFGRIRVIGTGLQPNSVYTVTHPYGTDFYETDETGTIKKPAGTEDIGCFTAPCDFTLALRSRVFGGFLKWENDAPQGYLGDGATLHTVTGSPTGNNYFKIEGPGLPAEGLSTILFTVSGKILVGSPPPPPPPPPPPAGGTELLTAPMQLTAIIGAAEASQSIPNNVLQGKTTLRLTYNLHGLCALTGDASAIIFDQGGAWHFISLSDFGTNCQDGEQTVDIPLSSFPGLDLTQPVGNFHTRFWSALPFTVDITSAVAVSAATSPALTSVTVAPATATINIGATQQLEAFPLDQNGAAFTGATTTWSSSNPVIASVDPNTGLVSGVTAGGPIIITATTISGAITVTGNASITVDATPPPPPPPPAGGTELLTAPMQLTAASGASEAFQSIPGNVLQGNTTLRLKYNLHGLCALTGDASAIIFDQGGAWHFISLSDFGTNCQDGEQTVDIPLSSFSGLDLTQPVGSFHVRFWNSTSFTVDITSATVSGSAPPPPPPPPPPPAGGTELLTAPMQLTAIIGAAEASQSIPNNVLQGKTTLRLTYNLHGLCALTGDASAIIFDQGGAWHFISLSDFGTNCQDGEQTVDIPLSSFPGLDLTQPVGNFHTRFWSAVPFTVGITSATLN